MSGNLTVDQVRKSPGDTYTDLVRGLAKAWVNLNGTGTIAIRDSLNVASITDAGTGSYTISYTASMADANYCHLGTVQRGSRVIPHLDILQSKLAGSIRHEVSDTANSASVGVAVADTNDYNLQVLGDLA